MNNDLRDFNFLRMVGRVTDFMKLPGRPEKRSILLDIDSN